MIFYSSLSPWLRDANFGEKMGVSYALKGSEAKVGKQRVHWIYQAIAVFSDMKRRLACRERKNISNLQYDFCRLIFYDVSLLEFFSKV